MGPKSLRSGLIVLALAVTLSVMIPSLAPTHVSFNAFCFIRKFGLAHWLRMANELLVLVCFFPSGR